MCLAEVSGIPNFFRTSDSTIDAQLNPETNDESIINSIGKDINTIDIPNSYVEDDYYMDCMDDEEE